MFVAFLVTVVVIGFLVRNLQKYKNKKNGKNAGTLSESKKYRYIYVFAAGVVTANGLSHFLHGILGYGEFPAPFAKLLGHGTLTDISNIVWGLFNFAVVFLLIIRYKKSVTKWKFVLLFILGVVAMSLLLRFVLISGYYKTHPF
jgi:hypothetical protein